MILGPTAVGKTAFALQLARENGWDILSCDSRQIYKSMDIGTAKPLPEQLSSVRHHLIDFIDPSETFSAYRFAFEAERIIRKSSGEGRTVLICGGTGLYFKTLAEGMGPQTESDTGIRDSLMEKGLREGSSILHDELKRYDAVSAQTIHKNDLQRIVRALAVYYQTGIPFSLQKQTGNPPDGLDFVVVKLTLDREKLYERIDRRVMEMVDNDLWDEFLKLINEGYTEKSPGLQCVGYKELFAVFRGECSMNVAVENIKRNTRRFAKRQTTWFKHQVNGFEYDQSLGYDGFLKDVVHGSAFGEIL